MLAFSWTRNETDWKAKKLCTTDFRTSYFASLSWVWVRFPLIMDSTKHLETFSSILVHFSQKQVASHITWRPESMQSSKWHLHTVQHWELEELGEENWYQDGNSSPEPFPHIQVDESVENDDWERVTFEDTETKGSILHVGWELSEKSLQKLSTISWRRAGAW